MKKLQRITLVSLALFLATFSLLSPKTKAQTPSLLFGQKHFYTVNFRKNGEAIVLARVVITNNTDQPLKSVKFGFGNDKLTEINALQMILPQACDKYATSAMYSTSTTCEKYTDPDYTSTYSYNPDGEKTKYYRLKPATTGNSFSIELNQPIEADKSGSVVVAYVSKSYVKHWPFGISRYNFRTLSADQRQNETDIAINLDSGLHFKTDYNNSCCIYPMAAGATMDVAGVANISSSSKEIVNPTLDNTVAQIGTYGQKNEKATGVAPDEQFSVKGEFADATWKLYRYEAFWSLVGIVALLALLVVVIRKIRRNHALLKRNN